MRTRAWSPLVGLLLAAIAAAGLAAQPGGLAAAARPAASGGVRIAVIGDYGSGSRAEAAVAALVKGWTPDFVVTTGDNNYPFGSASTIDGHIGQFYHEFISPYRGDYGPGADVNRFFPTLGNHDWAARAGTPPLPRPYLEYFALPAGPGAERYYDLVWGPVHLFAIDSDPSEPDGVSAASAQATWLRERLAASTAPWKLVVMHHPPYSSGFLHGSTPWMQWPYQAWGASAVLAGHDHTYERIVRDGFPYFVNGLGGMNRYGIGAPIAGSQARYNGDFGAMLIEADDEAITFRFVTRRGEEIDRYTLSAALSRRDPMLRPSQRRVR